MMPSRYVILMTSSRFQALEDWGYSKMNCLPALCWSSQISIENLIISTAPACTCGSISHWFAMENAVHGGDTTSTVGQSLLNIFFTSF